MSQPLDRACFGWSAQAWLQPWRAFLRAHPGLRVGDALEVGAGALSSLAPLLLPLADRVECSSFDPTVLPQIKALNESRLGVADRSRLRYSRQDMTALQGRWDLIVLKSVLGGVYRVHNSTLADVHAAIKYTVQQHLNPGGMLVTLDNGCTLFEPLLRHAGARRNGWRFFRRNDLPLALEHFSFGVVSVASAATRLGAAGRLVDRGLYRLDRVLSPLARQHAVHLHVYQRSS